jgi:prolyl oligopeptidase
MVAYSISTSGSDWSVVKVFDVKSKSFLPNDELKWIKHSSNPWTNDNKGFFYTRYDEPKNEGSLKPGQET